MDRVRPLLFAALVALFGIAGCATRPVNPPITAVEVDAGYTFLNRQQYFRSQDNLVILAFSGGGTRAAAFSYGVLEYLRRTEAIGPAGAKIRLLDAVDIITGVSGGSFTALAYGLYGDKLFVDYERRFRKRDVQGELIARAFTPSYWSDLVSTGWGRSELAANYYDEIVFDGATFGDLNRGTGPIIMASATDISSGGRFVFNQTQFNVLCSDLNEVRLSRGAAASSAVPVMLSTVTFNHYGGTCGFKAPQWVTQFVDTPNPPRPAARVIRELKEGAAYADSNLRPYVHLVDGGIADNVAMRGVLDALQLMEAMHGAGQATPLDHVKRIIVFVVNSLSSPPTNWDRSVQGPGVFDVLIQATGVPIDHYSYEAVEQLKDIAARWQLWREVRVLAGCPANPDLPTCKLIRPPMAEVYAIHVSFDVLPDAAERDYLNLQPTSFALPAEAVDWLRAAAGTAIEVFPEFQRPLKDLGARVVAEPSGAIPSVAH